MKTISQEELDSLSTADLVQRMDQVLTETHVQRYGSNSFNIHLVSHLTSTIFLENFEDIHLREAAHITFSLLLQFNFTDIAHGISNRICYDDNYTLASWQSPLFRLRHGALDQYIIISSRIVMENFMSLLYFLQHKEVFRSKKSKLGDFRKWICNPDNIFHYFAYVLVAAYKFDRQLRSPEIHADSRFPKRILRMDLPSAAELNEHNYLENVLASCWAPLITILNGGKPASMNILFPGQEAFFMSYVDSNKDQLALELKRIFDIAPY